MMTQHDIDDIQHSYYKLHMPVRDIANKFNVHRTTICRIIAKANGPRLSKLLRQHLDAIRDYTLPSGRVLYKELSAATGLRKSQLYGLVSTARRKKQLPKRIYVKTKARPVRELRRTALIMAQTKPLEEVSSLLDIEPTKLRKLIGYRWTANEVNQLRRYYFDGIPINEIADRLHRTYSSTHNKIRAIKHQLPRNKETR